MKRSLLILLSAAGMAFGCTKTPGGEEAAPAVLKISDHSLPVGNHGGELTLTVESNYAWTASVAGDVKWVSIDTPEGPQGKTEVAVIVAPSYDEQERTATVNFTSKESTETFTLIQEATFLSLKGAAPELIYQGETLGVAVDTNALEWSVDIVPEQTWCSVAKTPNKPEFTITAQPNTGDERGAVLRLTAGGIVKETPFTQIKHKGSYDDREVVLLEEAATGTGAGANLVFMGEGYTIRSMKKGGGKYETDIRTAIDHFFSVYPLSAYRDHFNIWMVGAVSNEEGMSVLSPRKKTDTKFECEWEGGRSTGIMCNVNKVLEYSLLVSPVLDDMTVIMPINMEVYAGTCLMGDDGLSIAMCPTGETFQEIVVHEGGGHGFAKLADEYIYYPDNRPTGSVTGDIESGHRIGELMNVDLSGNIATSPWAGFGENPDYSMVGYWEGAYMYGKGIWRSEFNSCMNDNVLYFNAPSRWIMVRRIMKLANLDVDYTVAEFMTGDVIPEYPEAPASRTRAIDREFVPLAPPRRIEMSF